MDSPKPPKNIEESELYSKNKLHITKDVKALDDTLSGVIYTIASKPEEFPYANEQLAIRLVNCSFDENTSFTIYFIEYDTKVILLDIELAREEDNLF